MKQLALAISTVALSITVAPMAHADFTVVRFNSQYCRVWTPPSAPPQDFQYLAFRRAWNGHVWWQHVFATHPEADAALQKAIAAGRCRVR